MAKERLEVDNNDAAVEIATIEKPAIGDPAQLSGPAFFDVISMTYLGPLVWGPDAPRLDPDALPRCKWIGTFEDEQGMSYIQWHRAGEVFTRCLKVTLLCVWKEEIEGFTPLDAMRLGVEFGRVSFTSLIEDAAKDF